MRYAIIVLMTMLSLTACSATPTGKAGLSVPVYSKAERKEVYDELKTCGDVNRTVEFLKDYKVLRDQARVGN